MQVSKRFLDRAKGSLRRYQKVLGSARTRDVNESDTCVIISDFLADVLGYDKYSEVTTEFAIKSTFCDLAVRAAGKLVFLIEVKSVGTDLKDNHLRQAVDYAANEGVEWVLLTNGVTWQAYRVRFEQPISHDLAFSLDLLDPTARANELLERLYLISREGASATAIASYWQRKEATSRYVVAQLLLAPDTIAVVRRQLRQLFPGIKVSEEDIATLLASEVVKREAIEGDRAAAAQKLVRKSARRRERARAASETPAQSAPPVASQLPS